MGRLLQRALNVVLLTGCIGIASIAQAAQFTPPGAFNSATGAITIRTPSTFGAPITCAITMAGNVSAFTGVHITNIAIAGSGFCSLLKPKLSSWRMNAWSMTSALIDDVGFSITGFPPVTNCGLNQIYASWDNATHQLTVFNQALSGNCTLERMDVVLPTLSIMN